MKIRKFLAVVLLIAMSFSIMTVSAAADFADHVNTGLADEKVEDTGSEDAGGSGEVIVETEDSGYEATVEGTEDSSEAPAVSDFATEDGSFEASIFELGEYAIKEDDDPMSEVVEVSDPKGKNFVAYTKWDDAMSAASDGCTVRLLKDLEFSGLVISDKINLDLNGHTITITPVIDADSSSLSAMTFVKGGTMKNGTVSVPNNYDEANKVNRYFGAALCAYKGSLSLKGVTVSYKGGLNGEGKLTNGTVTFGKGCVLDKHPGSGKLENGFKLEEQADGTFKVVSTTPDAARIGDTGYTYITEALKAAKDGDVIHVLRDVNPPSGLFLKDYSAKEFVINLDGCTFTGDIEVAGGKTLDLIGGTVNGTIYTDSALTLEGGAKVRDVYVYGGSFEVKDDSTEVRNIIAKDGSSIKVSGGTVNSIDGNADKITCEITGGTFKTDPGKFIDKSEYNVTEEDGKFSVAKKNPVARIGSTEYLTFGQARADAKDNDEIVLLTDLGAHDFTADKNLTINLDGFTLKSDINSVSIDVTLTLKNGTLDGSVSDIKGSLEIDNASVKNAALNAGTVTVKNGTVSEKISGSGKLDAGGTSKLGTVRMNNGELNITGSGVSAKEIDLSNIGTSLDLSIEGGSFDKFTLAKEPQKVHSSITGGVFGTNPSGYTAKGYIVKADSPEKGKFEVVRKDKAVLTAPEKAYFMNGEAKNDLVFTCSEDITDEVYINGEKLVNKSGFTSYTVNGSKLTLYAKYLNTLESASYTVAVTPKSNIEKAEAVFVVLGDPTFTCTSVPAVYVHGSKEPLVFRSNYPIVRLVWCDEEFTKTRYEFLDADRKVVSVDGDWLHLLSLGTYRLGAVVQIVEGREEYAETTFEVAVSDPASLKTADGSTVREIKFYKDKNDADKNSLFFKVSPRVTGIQLDGRDLAKTDFQSKADSVTVGSAELRKLPAGRHEINFIFSSGAEKHIPLEVYPEYSFSAASYCKGSGKDLLIELSDMPDSVWVGKDEKNMDQLGSSDYTASQLSSGSWKIRIYADALEYLPEGTVVFSFNYGEVSAMISGFKICGAPSIKPVDSNKDCVWAYGSSTLGFKVEPDVNKVYVDGSELSSKSFSYKDGVLTLNSGFLKSIGYNEHHVLKVDTGAGVVSIEFETRCGIEPKNGNTHTKGGRKNLEFVCSDPINRVVVGNGVLKEDMYYLSRDGKTLTLKADFLNQLKADHVYDLTVDTDAGLAYTQFKILSPGSAAANPKTGDESGMLLWAAVLVLSGIGAAALLPRRKRQ